VPYIKNVIQDRKIGIMNIPGALKKIWLNPFMALQRKMALGHFRAMTGIKSDDFWALTFQADRTFRVSGACTGCGICVKVCPVQNIEMVNGKPQWLHHCENCTACFHWCPTQAIFGEMVGYEKHIEPLGITLKDMLEQTGAIGN
jgi:ferredoxin